MKRSRWVSLGASFLVAGAGLLVTQGFFSNSARGQGRVVAPEALHDVDIMQEKLKSAQEVLTALVNRDAEQIAGNARRLSALCKTDAWQQATNDPVYTHFSVEFQRQAEHLARMGDAKNYEGSAYVYQSLTATCISCHEHLRNVSPIKQTR